MPFRVIVGTRAEDKGILSSSNSKLESKKLILWMRLSVKSNFVHCCQESNTEFTHGTTENLAWLSCSGYVFGT